MNDHFQVEERQPANLTLIQYAIYNRCRSFVFYLLDEYKVLSHARQLKNIDPRVVVVNIDDPADGTLTYRLALDTEDE